MLPKVRPVSKFTLHRLRRQFSYDEETGALMGRGRDGALFQVGRVTEYGYLRVNFDGDEVPAHRLVWLYVHGSWPSRQIDHIDGDKLNNRLANLRDVTQTVNMQNQKRAYRNNQVGLAGAYFHKANGRFYSQIRVDGRLRQLGYFDTAEAAHTAFMAAKAAMHPGFVAP